MRSRYQVAGALLCERMGLDPNNVLYEGMVTYSLSMGDSHYVWTYHEYERDSEGRLIIDGYGEPSTIRKGIEVPLYVFQEYLDALDSM